MAQTQNISSYTLHNNFESYFFALKTFKRDFLLEKAKKYKKIKVLGAKSKKVFFGSKRQFNELTLINAVKGDAFTKYGETAEPIPFVSFVKFNDFYAQNAKICKIDIKAAYWYAAFYDFLQIETFEKGIKNKPARLAALGSLASQFEVFLYNSGIFVESQLITSRFRWLYFKIAKRIDTIMNDCYIIDNCNFGYYVDCIFCSTYSADKIIQFIENEGFFCTKEEVICNTVLDKYGNKYMIDSLGKAYFLKKTT